MFADHDRNQLRSVYLEAWRKAREGLPMEPLERQLAGLIAEHPEYHALLEAPDAALAPDARARDAQSNPFLHLGLHMAIREQVATDRPAGILAAWQALCARHGDPHTAEHGMIGVLAEALWGAQRESRAPDERAYLTRLQRLAGLPRSDTP